MHPYYRYVFKFGRGERKVHLHGKSVDNFWNDIYDLFNLYGKMEVEKLDGGIFKVHEINRLFKSIAEDMEDDCAEIDINIQPRCLEFFNIGEFDIFDMNGLEKTIQRYLSLEDIETISLKKDFCIMMSNKEKSIFIIVNKDINDDNITKDDLQKILEQTNNKKEFKICLFTYDNLSQDANEFVKNNSIIIKDFDIIERELNYRNLEFAILKYEIFLSCQLIDGFNIEPCEINNKRFKDIKFCIKEFRKASSEKDKRFYHWYSIIERVQGSDKYDKILETATLNRKDISKITGIMNLPYIKGSRHEGKGMQIKLRPPSKEELNLCSSHTKKLIDAWIELSE